MIYKNKKDQKVSITESSSKFNNLESMSVEQLITNINNEDAQVHIAVNKALPQIKQLVERIVSRMEKGGRVFYLGAGTTNAIDLRFFSMCAIFGYL